MLFSIPETGWWLITLGATVFFMISMPPILSRLPDELRATIKRQHKRQRRVFYVVIPVFTAAVLGMNLLRPDPTSEILFLYSVALVSMPVALFPVRARIAEATVTQLQNPGVQIRPDRLVTAWVVGFLCTVIVAAAVALTAGT
ncbi:hypothetical protein AB4Z54_02465 [Streptomyces sp. MCAF7]